MRLRDRLLGDQITRLGLDAKGFAYPSNGGGRSGVWFGANWSLDWLAGRASSQEYETVKAECSSALAVVLNTVTGAFPEADLCVEREDAEGEYEVIADHPAMQLVERPNPYMSGAEILSSVVRDLLTSASGSAYLVKRRGPLELWPVPSSIMKPVWPESGDVFIAAYELSLDGERRYLDPKDVIHFRNDIDHNAPSYGRCGVSYLTPLMRDLYIDQASADFTAAIMRNMGMPGAIIAPRAALDGRNPTLPAEIRDQFVSDYQARFTGAGRGRAMVTGLPVDVHQLGFDPAKMSLREIRQIAEERISAAYNVPAIVAGFGAGLEHATYANYEQAMRAFWNGCVIPLQRRVARTLTDQLLGVDFSAGSRARGEYFEFRHDHIAALQESETERRQRDRDDYLAGGLTHHQYVGRLGIEPEGPDFFLVGQTSQVVPAGHMPDVGHPSAVGARATAAMSAATGADAVPKAQAHERKADSPDRGEGLHWTDQEIEDESVITDSDLSAAEATIRDRSSALADLLDAVSIRGGKGLAVETKARYRWNPRSRRYYGADGRIVSKATVDAAMDDAVAASKRQMASIADRLIAGDITLVDYQLAMRDEIKAMHSAAVALSRGGWANITPRERGRIGAAVREQYKYLDRAVRQIENGERPIDGRVRGWSQQYAATARTTYNESSYEAAADSAEAAADTHEERWVRHAQDSCSGCIEQEKKNWVRYGTLPAIGTQQCNGNCKCEKVVRLRAATQ